jgi:hypothetical protein
MRLMFLSASEKDSDYHADCGMHSMHAVKGVGSVKFQLESRVSLEVVGVMYVLGKKYLFVSALEDMGYAVYLKMDRYSCDQRERIPKMQQGGLASGRV